MKHFFFALLALSLSACKQDVQTVVVAGDSWSFFVCLNKSFEKPFANAGLKNVTVNSTCAVTTRVGIHAEEWLDSNFHKATQVALVDSSVKVLYLSLGGNDLMNDWNKSMSPAEREKALIVIRDRVKSVVDVYRKQRPDIKILISGYDYPRFTPNHPVPEYREAYEAMGSPTPLELNSVLQEFSTAMASLSDGKSVFFIQHLGLMHYYFGNREAGLAALQTVKPSQISPPSNPAQVGGDIRWPSDAEAMLNVGDSLLVDAFHLKKAGYEKLADHCVQHYLKSWLAIPANAQATSRR